MSIDRLILLKPIEKGELEDLVRTWIKEELDDTYESQLMQDKLMSLVQYAEDERTAHWFASRDWPTLIRMHAWEFCEPLFAYERHEEHLAQQDSVKLSTTNQFTCSRCKQRECVFYTAQTRSGDEGMTQYITCMKCGKNWKM